MADLLKTRAARGDSPRKVLFLTGTRADFGKLKPLIQRVAATPGLEYEIFVTGMHMLSRYGATIGEIREAGFDRLYSFINQDGSINSQMDLVLATTIQGLGHYLRESAPDLIVVHGDRVETLAGAIAGSLNNVLVAHIEGGELSGTIDELIRHAVTKLSHLHFVANDEARSRLLQMGESPESIFVIGSPDVDVMLSDRLPTLDEVRKRYAIPFSEYGILIYHPVTTELDRMRHHADAVVGAVEDSGRNFVVIYPNNDAGSDVIMAGLERLREHPRFRFIPSMRFEFFLSLLRHAEVIAGNSSAGIREAPVYGVPTVNIGSRQFNRYDYPSILNVPDDRRTIVAALCALPTSVPPSLHFGVGRSAELFVEQLRDAGFWSTPRQKQFKDRRAEPAAAAAGAPPAGDRRRTDRRRGGH
jgi:UDP-N-acetylglucosamine 2-epimerase (hydrolysing)